MKIAKFGVPVEHLGLFAKFWEPGKVKTRLAAAIGNALACQIYEAFLMHLLDRLGETANDRTIVFSPSHREREFRSAAGPRWQCQPQSEGHLGQRMNAFFQNCFRDNASAKVMVIGADCPHLTDVQIDTAFQMLDRHDVVLGPSCDGGYYLVGMNAPARPWLFEGITWSTPTVLRLTIDKLQQQRSSFALLDTLTDVDDLDSLTQLIAQAKQGNTLDPALRLQLQQFEMLLQHQSVTDPISRPEEPSQ